MSAGFPPNHRSRATRELLRLIQHRRGLALMIAIDLFIVVFVLRIVIDSTELAVGLLFTVPIALTALALGAHAGVIAALTALALVVVSDAILDRLVSVPGYVTRGLSFIVLGWLVGGTVDLLEDVERRLRDLERYSR